jgi:hypothetical protein
MKRALCLLIPVALLTVIVAPGCYTKVIPPSDEGYHRAGRLSDCADCHGRYQEYSSDYFSAPYPEYWQNHYDYASYYVYPWWRSDYECAHLCEDHAYASSHDSKFDRRDLPSEPDLPYDDEYWDPYPEDILIIPPPVFYPDFGGYGGSVPATRTETNSDAPRIKDTNSGSSGQKETRRTPRGETVARNSDNPPEENTGRTGRESKGNQNIKRSRGRGGGR